MTKTQDKIWAKEEYFSFQEKAEEKFDFLNGKLQEVPGGTHQHNKIAMRIGAEILFALDQLEKEYHVFNSDMKIAIPSYKHFVYPDAVVVCEQVQLYENRKDIITNPLLIVEVLSDSTEYLDRGAKFLKYKTLPSFKEYILVSQKMPRMETFYKIAEKTWQENNAESLEANIQLQSIPLTLELRKIYKGITF